MKLIGYARVSSKNQEENSSLDVQEEEIRAFAKYKKHEIVTVLREAKSGKDTNRRQYQKMLDMLPLVDGLVVAKLDRLGRSVSDLLKLVDQVLAPAGKALIILNLDIDTSTPQGKMVLTMFGALAEMERELIRERCASGRKAAREAGRHIGGGESRYGYTYDRDIKRIVEKEDEQKLITWMTSKYREGLTLDQIAEELNSQQLRSKLGSDWAAAKVSSIFRRLGEEKPVRKCAMKATAKGRQGLVNVSEEVKATIHKLTAEGWTQKQIASELNRRGLKSIAGGSFDQAMVCRIKQVLAIASKG